MHTPRSYYAPGLWMPCYDSEKRQQHMCPIMLYLTRHLLAWITTWSLRSGFLICAHFLYAAWWGLLWSKRPARSATQSSYQKMPAFSWLGESILWIYVYTWCMHIFLRPCVSFACMYCFLVIFRFCHFLLTCVSAHSACELFAQDIARRAEIHLDATNMKRKKTINQVRLYALIQTQLCSCVVKGSYMCWKCAPRIYIYLYIHTHTYIYICMYVYTYIHTPTHTYIVIYGQSEANGGSFLRYPVFLEARVPFFRLAVGRLLVGF